MKLPIYRFDKGNIKYEKISLTRKKILIFFIVQVIFSVGLIFGLSHMFNTPKESQLKKENKSREVIVLEWEEISTLLNLFKN